MRKALLFLCVIGLLMTSCEKDNDDNDNQNSQDSTLVDTIGNDNDNSTGGEDSNNAIVPCSDEIIWNEDINYGSVTDADGNEYRTVTIGDQEWMAENLKTTKFANGDPINFVEEDGEWANLNTPAYSWYLEENQSGDIITYEDCYGGLYNLYAAADRRNICPYGWHVPIDRDLDSLAQFLGVIDSSDMSFLASSDDLRSKTGWPMNDILNQSRNGTDKFGFRAFPNVVRRQNGKYDSFIHEYYMWKQTYWDEEIDEFTDVSGLYESYIINISANGLLYNRSTMEVKTGLSIRCIKD